MIRQTTERVAFVTDSTGFDVSPAAIATISDPMKEKMTTTMPSRTELGPLGKNPPAPARFSSPTGFFAGDDSENERKSRD